MRNAYGIDPISLDKYLTTEPDDHDEEEPMTDSEPDEFSLEEKRAILKAVYDEKRVRRDELIAQQRSGIVELATLDRYLIALRRLLLLEGFSDEDLPQ